MRAALRLVATVLLAIAIGVGVLAVSQEPEYQFGSHSFAVRFPIPLSLSSASFEHDVITAHGLTSPPSFRVSLATVSHQSPPPIPVAASASDVVVPARHLSDGSLTDIPPDPLAARWVLTLVNGFVREVGIYKARGNWTGNEIAFDERTAFVVSATSSSFRQVRGFLDSFVPLS